MSKALELADESVSIADRRLESDGYDWSIDADVQLRENAAELRRQHAEIEARSMAYRVTTTPDNANGDVCNVLAGLAAKENGEVEANARLIAAAPELLAAAKLVLAWYEAEENHGNTSFMERVEMCRESENAIRAAIDAATGEKA